MDGNQHWAWIERCREWARELEDIGETQAARDIELLIVRYIEALSGKTELSDAV